MQSMITNLAYGPPKSTANGLQYADFKALGDLAFTQLAELRHRGAFSTVSQTFAACCVRCAGSEMATIEALPRLWYQVMFLDLEPASFYSLCAANIGLHSGEGCGTY